MNRKVLSVASDPPVYSMVTAGFIPRFVGFLEQSKCPSLQFEAAWVLTNIASSSSFYTDVVVGAGAIPAFVSLLTSPHLDISEQAISALSKIAGMWNPLWLILSYLCDCDFFLLYYMIFWSV